MFDSLKKIPNFYYNFWLNFLKLEKRSKILPIDFSKHWTSIIWAQKKHLAIIISAETVIEVFYTLIPLTLGWIIEQKNISLFFILVSAWTTAIILQYVSAYSMTILETQCISSVQYNSYEFFLTADPIYHFKRASGKLFAKIERGARSYEGFLDLMLYDLGPTLISITTAIVSLIFIDSRLGIISFTMLLIIAIINIILNLITGTAFEPNLIQADDNLKAISIESLTQIQLVRASFASKDISQRVYRQNRNLLTKEGSAWLALGATFFITRLLYLISILLLGYSIINQIIANELSTSLGLTLILTYMRGTYQIITIGRKIRKLISAITRIKDLYTYIRDFGIQSFPVLSTTRDFKDDLIKAKESDVISLIAADLNFDYNEKAKIFENHYLQLEVPVNQKNKLYGVIGPSGMGKTTLLSILGGQLKPSSGQILINGINVYNIDDSARSQIIALQGQVSSSLSGTLKTTLLLGIPQTEEVYTNQEIIDVLEKVGIWQIFKEKDGLETYVGEAGLTLSGGQRQRLNFASLYLRANYFKPLLILIDEPTSSLDPLSEKAITEMIKHLSERSLTIVIAHRIHTLEYAVAIYDISLLLQDKKITFYPPEKLEETSTYYKKLLQGQIDIEN